MFTMDHKLLTNECAKWRALCVYAPYLTRPTRKNFWRAKIFDAAYATIFLTRQYFWRANLFDAPIFLTRQYFWRANIFDAPIFLTRQYLWRANIFDAPKLFTCQNSLHHARTYGLRTWIHRTLRQSVFFFTHGPPHRETPPKIPLLKQACMRDFVSPFLGVVPMF